MTTTARRLAQLTPEQRQTILSSISNSELPALEYSWEFWRQSHQAPPQPWVLWLLMAGRGAGKSWTGAQWARNESEAGRRSVALVAPTYLAGRKAMIEGNLLRLCRPDNMPTCEMACRPRA
jgi:phage terminase large subunit-like protein